MVKEGCSGSKSIEIPMAPINKVGWGLCHWHMINQKDNL
jgi:hypothetical protein